MKKTIKISRKKASELLKQGLKDTKSATFLKKDNTLRTITGRYIDQSPLGYIIMETSTGAIRSVNLQTLTNLSTPQGLFEIK